MTTNHAAEPVAVREKICTKCKIGKPHSEFVRAKTKRGLYPSCKECGRRASMRRYYANHETSKANSRVRQANPEYRAMIARGSVRYRQRHPEVKRAHHILNNAIRDGKIVRGSCQSCGVPNAHAHHHDYAKPLDVEWMCIACHKRDHRRTPEGIEAAARGA